MNKIAMWKLFLDDERFPFYDDWKIFRNVPDAIAYIEHYGIPSEMSLDHDLGENQKTGFDFVKELIEYVMDNNIDISNVSFHIHSQNPIGKQNMQSYWDSYKKIHS